MDPTAGLLASLLKPLVSVTSDQWERKAQFKLLQHVAHERLGRELDWNLECLRRHESGQQSYLALLRMDTFDTLVQVNLPLDWLFSDAIQKEWLNQDPFNQSRFQQRVSDCIQVSDLLDQLYQRLSMLKHRLSLELTLGDTLYLQNLLLFTMAHVNVRRRGLRLEQFNLSAWIQKLLVSKSRNS